MKGEIEHETDQSAHFWDKIDDEIIRDRKPMKNAIVFGGSRGIGLATCDLLSSKDWNAIGLGRSDLNMESISSIMMWYTKFIEDRSFPVDAIVFSHGEWFSKPIGDHRPTDYFSQYESRVLNPLRIISTLVNELKVASGSVTFVSSTRGFIGGVETGPYSLACAAQIAMVQGFAREYEGIRFNVCCPGLTDTSLGAEVIKTGGAKPGAPMNDPKVVAEIIVRLIEGEMNGKIIRVVDNKATEANWTW